MAASEVKQTGTFGYLDKTIGTAELNKDLAGLKSSSKNWEQR